MLQSHAAAWHVVVTLIGVHDSSFHASLPVSKAKNTPMSILIKITLTVDL
jgi:hypothetical protein